MIARQWRASASLLALLVVFATNTFFFMTYNTWDKFAFLLPSFIILAFVGVFAVRATLRWAARSSARSFVVASVVGVSVMTPPYLYAQLSRWGANPGYWNARYNNNYTFNTHDCAVYITNPNKGNYGDIATFADLVFELLPKNAILVDSDSRTYYPLRYFQVYENARPDIRLRLVNSWGFDDWGLSRQDFSRLLERVYLNGEELFLVSLAHPFVDFLAQENVEGRYEFQPFELETGRWIYRLSVREPEE